MSDLNARLQAAHAAGDCADLVELFTEAADGAPDDRAAGFFLTNAYVYALELGHPKTASLRARLVSMDREPA